MTPCSPYYTAEHIVFIVNPRAARGAVGKQWPRIKALSEERLGSFRCLITSGPGDARAFARGEVVKGASLIVCVGGDGTLNEIVNGVMENRGPVENKVAVGFIPFGTGCDFRRTLCIPGDLPGAVKLLAEGRAEPIDIGRLTYLDHEGRPSMQYFHNVTSFGLGGEVDERVNRAGVGMGGFLSFLKATLISLLLYDKKRIRLRVDGIFDETFVTWNVAVANGKYHGGGMCIAPGASARDGLFEVTIVGDLSLAEILYHLPKLYNGRIGDVRKVRTLVGKRVEASSDQRVLLDVDGEQPGLLPAVVDIVPGAMRFIIPGEA
ncbi:MAG: diacylglycerol kinase family lipid kinase [Deltaproteobacteria bacterium]|nr:diacylglycerol kinase family lipid kinase [Deltaproteobacteria bacterium]